MSPKAKKEKAPPYWWFDGESFEQLRSLIAGAGAGSRLEVHIDGKQMTLHVVPSSIGPSESGGVVNQSHICPPICP